MGLGFWVHGTCIGTSKKYAFYDKAVIPTWRVGGLGKWVTSRLYKYPKWGPNWCYDTVDDINPALP